MEKIAFAQHCKERTAREKIARNSRPSFCVLTRVSNNKGRGKTADDRVRSRTERNCLILTDLELAIFDVIDL